MTTSRRAGWAVLLAGVLAGCDRPPGLYRVTGRVTFNGKPVPAGTVYFDPDPTRGTRGTQGSASIRNGRFDTAVEGQGVGGGHYEVRVCGYDGKAGNEAPLGQGLFPEYTLKRELPTADSELAIEVPGKMK